MNSPEPSERTSRSSWPRQLVPLVPLGAGVAGCAEAFRLSLGSLAQPGPGLWPLVASGALIATSVVLLVSQRRAPDDVEPLTRDAWRIAVGVGLMVVFTVLLTVLGLAATLLGVLVVWLRFVSRESWRAAAIYATAATVGFYLLFVVFLGVPALSGYLPQLLGVPS